MMALLLRQINSLCKRRVRAQNSVPFRIKVLETSNSKCYVCALFIISPNHQYSTLRNGKTLDSRSLLSHRLAVSKIASGLLSTDAVVDKVQNVQAASETTASFVTIEVDGGSARTLSSDTVPGESVISTPELSSSDHVETVLSSGTLSEDLATTLADTLSAVNSVEVPLSELGLARWTPVGLVQRFIELLHVNLDLPWWTAIVIATFIARVLLFPVLVKAQQNSINLANTMPQLQALQAKFNRARCSGNAMEASRLALEIQLHMKTHNINPLKSAFIPLIQAPVFISFFIGLRSMANLPVESMKTGGLWWITDLTVADPYYITPLVTCATLYVVIKLGAESGMKLENMKMARYVLSALPVLIFPFTIHFPAAVLCYWCTTNFFTLGAVSLLKVGRVRKALNIPMLKPVDPDSAQKKKGFIKGIKEAFEDQKMVNSVAERSRMDEIRFKKAGLGPIPRTYAYDPTKPRPAAAAAARQAQAKGYKP